MTFRMDLNEARFTLTDVVKIVSFFVMGAIAWATISIGLGNIRDDVGEIRATQIENTKKNEIRDEIVEKRLSQIETGQKLQEMRLLALEKSMK